MMRIGLVGASRIAPTAVIEPAARRSDVKVIAVAASDPMRAAAFASRFDIPNVAQSYGALLGRDDVDVVYCALPALDHTAICEQALAAGKMVVLEKPFAADANAARRMVDAADAARLPVIEAFHYRFHGQFARAVALVRAGALGRLCRAKGVFDVPIARTPGEFRWTQGPNGGGTMDLGCYVIHALRSLLGVEPSVEGVDADMEGDIDTSLRAALAFGDVSAVASCSMVRPITAKLVVEGEAGTLTLHNFVAPQDGGRLVLRTANQVLDEAAEGPTTYEAQLDHIVQVLRGQAQPLTGGSDAIANMAVIDACRRAAQAKENTDA